MGFNFGSEKKDRHRSEIIMKRMKKKRTKSPHNLQPNGWKMHRLNQRILLLCGAMWWKFIRMHLPKSFFLLFVKLPYPSKRRGEKKVGKYNTSHKMNWIEQRTMPFITFCCNYFATIKVDCLWRSVDMVSNLGEKSYMYTCKMLFIFVEWTFHLYIPNCWSL